MGNSTRTAVPKLGNVGENELVDTEHAAPRLEPVHLTYIGDTARNIRHMTSFSDGIIPDHLTEDQKKHVVNTLDVAVKLMKLEERRKALESEV